MGTPVLLITHHAGTMSQETHRREAAHATGQGYSSRMILCSLRFASHHKMERVLTTTNRRLPVRARPIVAPGPRQVKRDINIAKKVWRNRSRKEKWGNEMRSGWWARS
jgi:hypothetical protein